MSNEFDYTKLKHATSVDQSDREVPYNLKIIFLDAKIWV